MEKSSSLKDDQMSNIITDDPYCSWLNNKSDQGDLVGGFSWPPRSYTCTFCKREFRSAQALGGHMNVHRRDRARLRQIPSSSQSYTLFNLNLNLHPSPNPNFPPSSTTVLPSWISSSSPSSDHLISPPTDGENLTTMMKKSQIPTFEFGSCKFDGISCENKLTKSSEIVRLKLEIGLLGESRSDDLDLELRLSCS